MGNRFWIDTEFISHPGLLQLISIGVVSESGQEFYAISKEFDEMLASDWVKKNVIQALERRDEFQRKSLYQIATEFKSFVEENSKGAPEFWADYGAYDFVAVSMLMGDPDKWPSSWPFFFHDLQQWRDSLGIREEYLPKQESGLHNALADARHNQAIYVFLEDEQVKDECPLC